MFNSLSHKLKVKNLDYMELQEAQQKPLVDQFADDKESFNWIQKCFFEFRYSINKYYGNKHSKEIFFSHLFGLLFHIFLHVSYLIRLPFPMIAFIGSCYLYLLVRHLFALEIGRCSAYVIQIVLLVF